MEAIKLTITVTPLFVSDSVVRVLGSGTIETETILSCNVQYSMKTHTIA